MMRTQIIVSLLAAFLFTPAFGVIKESGSLAEAVATLDDDTLLILDLDNTVMKPADPLGSDQWYDYVVAAYIKHGLRQDEALDRADMLWEKAQLVAKMVAVEAATAETIATAQSKGVPVIALTARPPELAPITFQQLASIGVLFTPQAFYPSKEVLPVRAADDAMFHNGVLFAGPKNSKGPVLAEFFRQTNFSPRRVVFIDDKMVNVQSVAATLEGLSIPFLGFRYSGADADVSRFTAVKESFDLRSFDPILD